MKLTINALLVASSALLLASTANAEDDNWADRVSLSGDLRLRYEVIDSEAAARRERARYRARLALSVQASDTVKVVIELASGADDPVSRNVTFDGGFSADDIGFDLAYADWTPTDGMHVFAGKMKNPLYRAGGNALIWDGDLNPEGVALTYDSGMWFGHVAHFWVEERSSEDDSTLSAVQLGAQFDVGTGARLTAGVGYFAYSNTAGFEPFYDASANGNTVDLLGLYVYDYRNTELFAQFDTKIGDLPLQVFAHTTRNGDADEQDAGFTYGARLGAAKEPGQWEASLTYANIEADAVVGTFNDSDFGGGGTDADGLILKGKYAVSKNIAISGTYFSNAIDVFRSPERDYDRLQLDVEFKFK